MHAPTQAMPDAYEGLGKLYLALHTPDATTGQDIHDPVMSRWLAENLPHGARVLDAGCGLGLEVVALHNGLPARRAANSFIVYGTDYSEDMLEAAMIRGARAGVPAYRYQQASFADLAHSAPWRDHMDAVTVNYALYSAPADVDYDTYLRESLQGLAAVVKPGGTVLANFRAWDSLLEAETSGTVHAFENTHGPATYRCLYSWQFGTERVHESTLTLSDDRGRTRSTTLVYVERTLAELLAAFEAAGLEPKVLGSHGEGAYRFHTLAATKPA